MATARGLVTLAGLVLVVASVIWGLMQENPQNLAVQPFPTQSTESVQELYSMAMTNEGILAKDPSNMVALVLRDYALGELNRMVQQLSADERELLPVEIRTYLQLDEGSKFGE